MNPHFVSCFARWGRAFTAIVCAVALIGTSGCGTSDGRLPVSGSINVDGEPLDGGSINFQPPQGAGGHSSGGPVRAGKFDVPAKNGLLPGAYRVTIVAIKKTGRIIEDPQKGPTPELVQITFRELPGDITVVEGENNEYQFDLNSVQ